MARCIINVSTQKYWKGQDRLIDTLKGKTDADLLMFRSEQEVMAKPHSEMMYSFKPRAFVKAQDLGYTSLLWLDASMYAIKDLNPLFEHIEQHGYFFQNSGWKNSDFYNSKARRYYGEPHGDMISSGVLGLSLTNPDSKEFLFRWFRDMTYGMFNGSHSDWRHDQSSASLTIQSLGLTITENNTFWQYGKPDEPPLHENILIVANGIC